MEITRRYGVLSIYDTITSWEVGTTTHTNITVKDLVSLTGSNCTLVESNEPDLMPLLNLQLVVDEMVTVGTMWLKQYSPDQTNAPGKEYGIEDPVVGGQTSQVPPYTIKKPSIGE